MSVVKQWGFILTDRRVTWYKHRQMQKYINFWHSPIYRGMLDIS